MGKKNSGSLVASTSNRGHRHPRGAGRSAGRGFTGHRGRGGKANRYHDGPGMDERPESAVDDVEEDEGSSEEGSGQHCTRPKFYTDPDYSEFSW